MAGARQGHQARSDQPRSKFILRQNVFIPDKVKYDEAKRNHAREYKDIPGVMFTGRDTWGRVRNVRPYWYLYNSRDCEDALVLEADGSIHEPTKNGGRKVYDPSLKNLKRAATWTSHPNGPTPHPIRSATWGPGHQPQPPQNLSDAFLGKRGLIDALLERKKHSQASLIRRLVNIVWLYQREVSEGSLSSSSQNAVIKGIRVQMRDRESVVDSEYSTDTAKLKHYIEVISEVCRKYVEQEQHRLTWFEVIQPKPPPEELIERENEVADLNLLLQRLEDFMTDLRSSLRLDTTKESGDPITDSTIKRKVSALSKAFDTLVKDLVLGPD